MSQTIKMPPNYLRCVAEEGKCPMRETCLRSKVHREADYTQLGENYRLQVVNLWNAGIKPQTEECKAYRKAELKQFAQGFCRLFDAVPKGIYATVQTQIEQVFSNRLFYFRCKKGSRLTSPKEQQEIANIFEQNGIKTAPVYDKIVEEYDYTE